MLKKIRHLLTLKAISKRTGINLATVKSYSKWERNPSPENETKLKNYFLDVAEQINVIAASEKKPRINKEEFEEFWNKYPRKIGKKAANSKYQTVRKDTTHEKIMEGLERYNTYIRKERIEFQYIAHPSTWLNQGRRDDEYKGTVSVGAVNQQVQAKPKEEKREMTEEEKQRAKEAIKSAREKMLYSTAV